MSSIEISAVLELPVAKRLRLLGAILDSIAENPDDLPLSDAELEGLDRRWADYLKNPAGTPWSEVKIRR